MATAANKRGEVVMVTDGRGVGVGQLVSISSIVECQHGLAGATRASQESGSRRPHAPLAAGKMK